MHVYFIQADFSQRSHKITTAISKKKEYKQNVGWSKIYLECGGFLDLSSSECAKAEDHWMAQIEAEIDLVGLYRARRGGILYWKCLSFTKHAMTFWVSFSILIFCGSLKSREN